VDRPSVAAARRGNHLHGPGSWREDIMAGSFRGDRLARLPSANLVSQSHA
jgi:hypothetical protein